MSYLLLIVFWAGVLVLKKDGSYDLKKRAGKTNGRGKEKGVDKRTVSGWLRSGFAKEAVIREISDSLGYVKNIAILGRSSEFSAQILLSELADASVKLKPVYEEMARYLSTGEKENAGRYFVSRTGLDISPGLGELLTGWDDVDPRDILETVDSYLTILREEKITAQKRKNEILSDLIYFPVVINCMLVLIDFLYITFFTGQQDAFTLL